MALMEPTTLVYSDSYRSKKVHRCWEYEYTSVFTSIGPVKAWKTSCGSTLSKGSFSIDLGPSLVETKVTTLCRTCFNLRNAMVSVSASSREVF
jgi:hypothetical protein